MKTSLHDGPHSCAPSPLCVVYHDRLGSLRMYLVFQSTFFNGSKILVNHDPPWLIDHFLSETAAIPQNTLSRLAAQVSEDDSDSSSCSSDNQLRQWGPDGISSNLSMAYSDNNVELFEKGLARVSLADRPFV